MCSDVSVNHVVKKCAKMGDIPEKEKLQILNEEQSDVVDLDALLVHLGQFGKFQKRNFFLISLIVIYAAFPFGYVFTTRKSEYRCFIDGCDDIESPVYETSWMTAAIPNSTIDPTKPEHCHRYPLGQNVFGCNRDAFVQTEKIPCENFVFLNADATIEKDFNVTCDENILKLTMVGTLDNLGELFFLPLSGFISDRFGRRTTMILGVLAGTFCALFKSFAVSYTMFLMFEIFETFLSCGVYSAAYILAVELVPPEKRVLASTVISCAFATGEAILGLVAWLTGSWRTMLQILYVPGVFFIFYFWLVNESVRWNLSRGDTKAAKRTLLHVASVNRTTIPEDTIRRLGIQKSEDNKKRESFWTVFTSTKLSIRLLVCSLVWICCVFVYYGFTLHAVAISGNLYFNFIAVTFIEIPAYFVSYFTLDVFGRKKSLCSSLILGGLASFAFIFVPEASTTLRLLLFLVGKFSATVAFTALYMFTTELFPTSVRHQLLSTCSTFGRIGSMIAPQIPLLAQILPSLPMILFGVMATIAGILSLTFPETLNTRLPDTIHEAENIQLQTEYA